MSMEQNNTYEQAFKIYSYFVDDNRNLTLPNLMYFMQEVAWAHSNNNEIGWHFLQTKNMFWALVKLYIQFDRMPRWNETIRIKTWGRPSELIVYPREFEIFDEQNQCIIKATSAWVILDKDHFKPQLIKLENEKNIIYDCCVLERKIPKIQPIPFNPNSSFSPVLHSDIDMNKHVNNTRYALWILDEYGHKFHETHKLKSCKIHFVSQTKYGEQYTVQKTEITKNVYISSIFTKNNTNEVCRIALEWEDMIDNENF